MSKHPTIAEHLEASGVSRRSFIQLCSMLMATAPVGLSLTSKKSVFELAAAIGKTKRPSVIWLHFQDCTGCTETLLRTSAPDVAHLILDVISLDYHETLMAASGAQAEAALRSAVADNEGKYVLVVEGAIPMKDDGVYMELDSKPAVQILREVAAKSAAVIAIGSCASWGGVPSADPNPTGAVGVDSIITGKPVINLPGCPPNPYNLLGVVLEYVTMGKLPHLTSSGVRSSPTSVSSTKIVRGAPTSTLAGLPLHSATKVTAKAGACTNSAARGRSLMPPVPRGISMRSPIAGRSESELRAIGCTEKGVVWRMGTFETVPIHLATPPDTYPPIYSAIGGATVGAAALVGAVAGALGGVTWVHSQRFASSQEIGVERIEADRARGKTRSSREDSR